MLLFTDGVFFTQSFTTDKNTVPAQISSSGIDGKNDTHSLCVAYL